MSEVKGVIVDGVEVPIAGERNLLELIRKTGTYIPTFCYHSELSVYGACRLCIVDIEGMGIVTSCSTQPRPGMVVRTSTKEIRETRKMTVELLLADHKMDCPTCGKNGSCQLQALAQRMGIREVRFKKTREFVPVDDANPSLLRDPSKCVLCGDCVRMCNEVQGVAALDFAHRGSNVTVGPAYGRNLGDVACVYCGQCARVCPTGAIVPKSQLAAVWATIDNPDKTVVAQVAPAVRVALGESFGMAPGTLTMGKIVAALRHIGFDRVYDTSFAADLTVYEEAHEFIGRKAKGENLPQFTSCCPAWVKFAEQYFPEVLSNISSCRSPQQMFGSLAKAVLPDNLGVERKDLVIVSIMPCTAKKFEASLDKFKQDNIPDVDHVLSTQELAQMIKEAGIDFNRLEPESLDMPFGFKSGAGVIFGTTGGVSEAVVRYVAREHGVSMTEVESVRGTDGIREAVVSVDGVTLQLAVVHGLANARIVAEAVRKGESPYDLIEVMACPGGCVNGGGQPVSAEEDACAQRARGLYENDKELVLRSSQDNPYIKEMYDRVLGGVGSDMAHKTLHTGYNNRRRLAGGDMDILIGKHVDRLEVSVCVGTSCHVRGAQKILSGLVAHVREKGLDPYVDVKASFCTEQCDRGPVVRIGKTEILHCTLAMATETLENEVRELLEVCKVKPGKTGYLTQADFENQVAASLTRFLRNHADQAATEGEDCEHTHQCASCSAKTGSGCIHE